jgi:thiamine-phosphate pyrophosphorylase
VKTFFSNLSFSMRTSKPSLCYITDRRALGPRQLGRLIETTAEAGIDMVQIREKDMPARAVLDLATSALDITRGTSTRIVVNDRLDIALATGADGVHLGGESMPAAAVRGALRPAVKDSFWIGVSCHSLDEVRAAEAAGASYVLLGPIFDTASKRVYGPPLGLEALREAARICRIPLLAVGGVTLERVRPCLEGGATGIAGISIFQRDGVSLAQLKDLRREIARWQTRGSQTD